ncbi:MAG: isoprenylcysteine carboxylmethyltransferase family protein [Methyloceanibacter sp.]
MRVLPVKQRTRIHAFQAGGILLATVFLLTQPVLVGQAHELLEMTGLGLVAICVAGRVWSSLYIGSRKNRVLVTSGPYSITRNPLYLFSTIGAVGIGLIFGSIAAALGLGLLAYGVFMVTATKEAEHLSAIFGSRYDAYARQTPLFWPNVFHYRDLPEVAFSPKALRRTFVDGLLFLAAFPAIEAIEHLQTDGTLPILMRVL